MSLEEKISRIPEMGGRRIGEFLRKNAAEAPANTKKASAKA